MNTLARIIRRLWTAYEGFNRHEGALVAAGIAYYLALSFFPLLLVLASAIGYLMTVTHAGQGAQQQLLEAIADQASPELSQEVGRALAAVTAEPAGGTIGFALLIFAALALFAQFDYAFDRIFGLPAQRSAGWLAWLLRVLITRLKALGMLAGVGAFVISVMIASVAWGGVQKLMAERLPVASWLQSWGEFGVTLTLNGLAFATLYRFMPRMKLWWRDALAGGFVAAVLWDLGRQLLTIYLLRQNYPTAYGIIGSFLAILLWAYYATLVVLYGAEYVRVVHEQGLAWRAKRGEAALP
jgi:membrane protein